MLDGKINDYKGSIHSLEVKIKHLKLQVIPDESVEELKKYTREELEEINFAEIEKELEAAETHLRVAKPNLNAIEVSIFFIGEDFFISDKNDNVIYVITISIKIHKIEQYILYKNK